jgi:hypothetical protein
MKRQTGPWHLAGRTVDRPQRLVRPRSSRPRSAPDPKPQVEFVQDFGVPRRGHDGHRRNELVAAETTFGQRRDPLLARDSGIQSLGLSQTLLSDSASLVSEIEVRSPARKPVVLLPRSQRERVRDHPVAHAPPEGRLRQRAHRVRGLDLSAAIIEGDGHPRHDLSPERAVLKLLGSRAARRDPHRATEECGYGDPRGALGETGPRAAKPRAPAPPERARAERRPGQPGL